MEKQKIAQDIIKLYQMNYSERSFRHYDKAAIFNDPITLAEGLERIMTAFKSMAWCFSSSETVFSIIDDSKPDLIQIDMLQRYKTKRLHLQIPVRSQILLHLREGKIFLHEDRWNFLPLVDENYPMWSSLKQVTNPFFHTHTLLTNTRSVENAKMCCHVVETSRLPSSHVPPRNETIKKKSCWKKQATNRKRPRSISLLSSSSSSLFGCFLQRVLFFFRGLGGKENKKKSRKKMDKQRATVRFSRVMDNFKEGLLLSIRKQKKVVPVETLQKETGL
jgi:hypothetical protein